ncbi:thermonuclease family protein [Candidatus Pacearchaeota archaeon]|nr:thermonuclease family protein [Candidatus Pacearchaeota archaeon]
MNPKSFFIAILFISSCIFYYQITEDTNPETSNSIVTRIIDGDTIELINGQKIRLKGINTPEKSMPFSQEATEFLEQLILNQSIKIESHGTDKYGRILAYIFLEEKNINKELLGEGLATLYYYEKDKYYDELKNTEEFARLNQKGLWKKSPNSNCLKLIELKYKEQPTRCSDDELLILENFCDEISVTIKDDATHIYKETLQKGTFTKKFSCIWNNDGDSLYVSDEKGLLIFHRYP